MCLACTFLVMMLAAPTGAYVSLGLSDGRCFDDGSFSMQVKNFGDTPIDLDRVRVTAMMNSRDDAAFDVTGSFDRDNLYDGSSYTTTTMFHSNTGNLNESGTYHVAVTYPDCRYGSCAEEILLERCPGFPYQCKLADVQIDRCFERNGALQIYVSGINQQQYERIDPLRELALSLRSNARTISSQYYADGVTIKTQGDDEYIVSVPLKPGEKVYEASLELARCSKPPTLREIDICTLQENDPVRNGPTVNGQVEDVQSRSSSKAAQTSTDDEEQEQDSRMGRNRITGHASADVGAALPLDKQSHTLSALTMAGVGLLWLAATLLVTTLLVQRLKRRS